MTRHNRRIKKAKRLMKNDYNKEENLVIEKDIRHDNPRFLMSKGFGLIEKEKRKIDVVTVSENWFNIIKEWEGYWESENKISLNGKVTKTNGKLWNSPVLILNSFNEKIASVISEGDDKEKLILINLILLENKKK